MTQVPQNVKRQREDGDKLLEDFLKGAAPAQGTPEPPAPVAPAPPAAEPPKPVEGTPPPAAPATTEDVATLKKQIEDLISALTAAQAVLADENRDTWKQKFHVIDGKYKAEIQPAAARIKELEADNGRLKTELEAAKTAKPVEKTPAAVTVTETDRKVGESWGVAPEELANYRQGIVDSVLAALPKPQPPEPPAPTPKPSKAPTSSAEPETEPAKSAISPDRAAFNALLDVKAKGWREAMSTPAFLEYLKANRDHFYVLQAADAQLDSDTVARVYNTYFKTAAPAPAAPTLPSREAAPTSPKGGGSVSPEADDVWTLERVKWFEDQVATGKIKLNSPEYIKLRDSRDAALDKATFSK